MNHLQTIHKPVRDMSLVWIHIVLAALINGFLYAALINVGFASNRSLAMTFVTTFISIGLPIFLTRGTHNLGDRLSVFGRIAVSILIASGILIIGKRVGFGQIAVFSPRLPPASYLLPMTAAILVGLALQSVSALIMRPDRMHAPRRMTGTSFLLVMTIMASAIVAISFTAFRVEPNLVTTPDLRGNFIDEVERGLADMGLRYNVKKTFAPARKGTVLWQSPNGGTIVEPGTVVEIEVSNGPLARPSNQLKISILSYKSGQGVELLNTASGMRKLKIAGTVENLPEDSVVLLWARRKGRNSLSDTPRWFLQPLDAPRIDSEGAWEALVQIGSIDWPPKAGDKIDVAISVVSIKVANELMNEIRPVTKKVPTGRHKKFVSNLVVQ